MAREADLLLPNHSGPEIRIVSTTAFICHLPVLAAPTVHMGLKKGLMNRKAEVGVVAHLHEAPASLNLALDHEE